MDSVRLSDDEAAILRSWLGGHQINDIARARRLTPAQVGGTIDRLCNYNRQAGQRVLALGEYTPRRPLPPLPVPRPPDPPPAPAEPALAELAPEPAPAELARLRAQLADAHTETRRLAGQLTDALTSRETLARQLDELTADARQAAEQRDKALADLHTRTGPAPLAEYGGLWCRECREPVSSGHGHPTEYVTVAILPREAP